MEYTKGEWKATDYDMVDGKRRYDVETADEVIVMDVEEANARLIAAAPDLYEACKEALELSHDPKVEKILMEAIAKIEK